jgi:aspartyl protease family protein
MEALGEETFMTDGDTTARAIYLVLILALLLGSLFAGWRIRGWEVMRYAGIWILLGFFVVVAYAFQPEARTIWNRIIGAVVPSEPMSGPDGTVNVRKALDGHYHVIAEVNGERVEMLVDTGASTVVLPMEVAKDLGVDVDALSFTTPFETANGRVMGASFRLKQVEIGGIVRRNVSASVVPDLSKPLLGMSFINTLSSYSVSGDTMTFQD